MTTPHANRRSLGVIGGLGALASADVFFKLIQSTPASTDAEHLDIVFEQHPFAQAGQTTAATTERKLYIFDLIRDFQRRGIGAVVLPCFLSHTFIDELTANSPLPIIDMMAGLRSHVRRKFPRARRIGVLASDTTRNKRLFERYFDAPEFDVIHPRIDYGIDRVTDAVYAADGIKSGILRGRPITLLREACLDLIDQGAELILPGLTEIALVLDELGPLGVPIVDSNLAYAQYVVSGQPEAPGKLFKVGVVGGVGPAATVDFMHKIVRNTPATRDQDHIKLLVEQNPQIPDRTENLIGEGPDPTISLYATCRKLEAGDADIIAIPCNTAHAYVERVQPYLGIPIVNMLTVTAQHIRSTFPTLRKIGLLATSGTVASGVYRKALEAAGLEQVVPSPERQADVMNAIYGPRGVKAGFTTGACVDDLTAAINEMAADGVDVVILGCTELPLILPHSSATTAQGHTVTLVDPTDVLARHCVARALGQSYLSNASTQTA
ncbi:aspartate racemase [Burkholderia sp. MSMB1459WGS]|uniref:aspartate/glutamate racemase family protein n=1 Tax=Burkholderia sp. MSMB1459WGS TaxID=1637970 RepID=UPI00075FF87C|nr:amino acid racemase [Burkholderia sp. MSMB1459WGS]KWO35525.1 aspartate racemase [Burkholderia sp. MSMB1459WGS]